MSEATVIIGSFSYFSYLYFPVSSLVPYAVPGNAPDIFMRCWTHLAENSQMEGRIDAFLKGAEFLWSLQSFQSSVESGNGMIPMKFCGKSARASGMLCWILDNPASQVYGMEWTIES